MSYKSFYRYIYKKGKKYWIVKDGEWYTDCLTLAEALYERDRFEHSNWDWDKYVQLPHTINGYIHIKLPPFEHNPTHISEHKECWIVRGKGSRQKYHGTYSTLEEAKEVAKIYNANIQHKTKRYYVQRRIGGKVTYFGSYKTIEEAKKRVEELEDNDWEK